MRKSRQQWLTATLVLLTFSVQAIAIGLPSVRQAVFLATTAVVCVAAVFVRRYVLAVMGACAGIAANTVQTAAVVREADRTAAATVTAAISVFALHAALVRPGAFDLRRESAMVCVLMGVVAVATGLLLRSRDRERVVVLAAERAQARRAERLDMAAELHDVIAHHVAEVLVQAQAALVVSERDHKAAVAMLPGIIAGGTNALDALRGLAGTQQGSAAASATTDLAADLNALIGSVRRSGLPVRADIDLPEAVRPELGRSVLRLVQESLTNARRHARGVTRVEVEVRLTTTLIKLSISDNGTARPARSGGLGLVGLRERVDALGGVFRAGWTGEGWRVTAELPRA